jgi:hypothetical protein
LEIDMINTPHRYTPAEVTDMIGRISTDTLTRKAGAHVSACVQYAEIIADALTYHKVPTGYAGYMLRRVTHAIVNHVDEVGSFSKPNELISRWVRREVSYINEYWGF